MFITPKWSAPSRVKAVSTTRAGGVSKGVYASLNLGLHVGDNDTAVTHNREVLAQQLNLPTAPMWLNQTHGVNIVDSSIGPQLTPDADASYTNVANTVCAVMTADCMPLLLCNRAGTEVAAVHAGWRGMAAGIIEQAIARFECSPSDVYAWAGPCIGPQNFEIGHEVRDQLGGSSDAYQGLGQGKLLANLYKLAGERLSALEIAEYSFEDTCTYADAERFFSYRRDGQCGRMATLIWIESDA